MYTRRVVRCVSHSHMGGRRSSRHNKKHGLRARGHAKFEQICLSGKLIAAGRD